MGDESLSVAGLRAECDRHAATIRRRQAGPQLLVTTSHPSLQQHPDPRTGAGVHPNLGRLVQPRHYSSIEQTAAAGITWAADNDCFQGLDEHAYLTMLERIGGLEGCRFVTVPDVVGNAAETARQFDQWHGRVVDARLPVGLVAQDGLENVGVPWEAIDALFIGGTDAFKLGDTAAGFAREAQARGKWVHWGRVNGGLRSDGSLRANRLRHVVGTGACDSVDGSSWARWRNRLLDSGLELCRLAGAEPETFAELGDAILRFAEVTR